MKTTLTLTNILLFFLFFELKAQFINPNEQNFLLEQQKYNQNLPKNIQKKEQKALNTEQNYQLKIITPHFKVETPNIKAILLPKEPISKKFHNSLNIFYGNYHNFLGEIFLSKISPKTAFGVHLKNHTTLLGESENQRNSDSKFNFFIDFNLKNWILRNSLDIKYNIFNFYAFQKEFSLIDSYHQNFKNTSYTFNINRISTKNDYKFDSENTIYFWQDLKHHQETVFTSNSRFKQTTDKFSKIGFQNEVFLNIDNQALILQNSIFYEYHREKVYLLASVGLGFTNIEYFENKVKFLPNIEFQYQVIPEKIKFSSILNSKFLYNTYNNLSEKNNFINTQNIKHCFEIFNINNAISYNFLNFLYLEVEHSFSKTQNMPFFDNNFENKAYFDVKYDNVLLNELIGKISWKYNNFNIKAKTNYKAFLLQNLIIPYHEPLVNHELELNYKGKNYALRLKTNYYGNLYYGNKIISQLTDIVEVNSFMNYNLTEKMQFYIETQNLLGKSYERFFAYPSRKTQFLIGWKCSF